MAKPAGLTLRSQARYSGMAREGSQHFIDDFLGYLRVSNGSESAAIKTSIYATRVLFKGHVREEDGEYCQVVDAELCFA